MGATIKKERPVPHFDNRQPGFLTRFLVVVCVIILFFSSFKNTGKDVLYPASTKIVLPDRANPFEVESAATLRKWLRKIYETDSGFNVIKESLLNDVQGQIVIAVGNTHFNSPDDGDHLSPYSFTIKKKENVITLCGVDSVATLIATGYFLDHFCGVRFYIPGDLFTTLPKINRIELDKTIDVKEVPSTKYVLTSGYNNNADIHWAYINGLYRKNWGSHQHTMGDRFANEFIIKYFPEIFPIYNGQKYFPSSVTDQKWQPDFAEPKLIDAAASSTTEYFRSNPSVDHISFSVQDSRNYPTEGKMGQYLESYPQTPAGQRRGYTDAYVDFINGLANRMRTVLPGNCIKKSKTIVYLAYGEVNDVPAKQLNPVVLPITVSHIAESLMDSVFSEQSTGDNIHSLSEWAKVTSRIGNHDWAEGKGFIYPRIYTNLVSKFAGTVKKDKMNFEYAHIEAYPNWALDGPKLYFMGKIYWNATVDADSLLTLFCSDMFDQSKVKMKGYFKMLEDLNTSMNNDPKRNRRMGSYTTQLSLNTTELQMVGQARQLLNEASGMALTEVEKQRINFFSKGFKICEYLFDIYNTTVPKPQQAGELKNYLKDSIAGDGMMLNMAKDTDFLRKMDGVIDNILLTKKQH